MTYTQLFALATDSVFLGQVLIAMMNQAASVIAESPATAGHQQREALAVQVINNPALYQTRFAYAITTQGTITPVTVPSTVPDANVQTAVSNVWSAIAGYFPN